MKSRFLFQIYILNFNFYQQMFHFNRKRYEDSEVNKYSHDRFNLSMAEIILFLSTSYEKQFKFLKRGIFESKTLKN